MSGRISSKDITVIVQGHVRGKPDDPEKERWTDLSLRSVRRYLPKAQLILSTFQNSDASDLTFDDLVMSADPGYLDLGKKNRLVGNTNRQIISTRAGLKKADRPYVLKMRYDLVLSGSEFMEYFSRFCERTSSWQVLKQRIISCTSVSLNPRKAAKTPYAPSDWFHFGLLEDVRNLWEVPLIPPVEIGPDPDNPQRNIAKYQEVHNYTAEQYLWVSFLRKYGTVHFSRSDDLTHRAVDLTDLTIVNNLVLLEPSQIPVQCLKYNDPNLLTYSKQLNYTHAEWLQLYERYCLRSYSENGVRLKAKPATAAVSPEDPAGDHLLEVGLGVLNTAASIDFTWLNSRLDEDTFRTVDAFPGDNFRLLAALMHITQPGLVVEFGTGSGLTALGMRSQMKANSCLATVTCDGWGWRGPAGSLIGQADCAGGRLIVLDLDISLPVNLDQIIRYVAQADILVFNLDDGRLLEAILERLQQEHRAKDSVLVVMRNQTWSLAETWNKQPAPKLDLASFGHSEGFGLIELE